MSLIANDFAKRFEKSLFTRFATTVPSDSTVKVVTRVFRSEMNTYLDECGFDKLARDHIHVTETPTANVFQSLQPLADTTHAEEKANDATSVICRLSIESVDASSYWQLEITREQLNYALCIRIRQHPEWPELAVFFEQLSDHSTFYKALWAFSSQRKLPHLISEYHKTLDWRGVFSSYWTERFLYQQVTRVQILALFSIDLSALADAVNPLLLAIWQQWRVRRSSAFKRELWKAAEVIARSIEQSDSDVVTDTEFGMKYDNVGLLSSLLQLFNELKHINEVVTVQIHSRHAITRIPLAHLATNGHEQFIQLIANCMLVNYRFKDKKIADVCDSHFRREVLQLMLDVCDSYLRKQYVIGGNHQMRRLSRANLYVWLIHSILSYQECDATTDSSLRESKQCGCAAAIIQDNTRLFEDLCFLTESTGRYMLFRSGDYPYEGKPIKLAKTLLRVVDFHANHVLQTKLPSSLMQLLVDSFEAEHQFSSLKDASQHIQHLTDLYIFGQYLASDDFKIRQLSTVSAEQPYNGAENQKIKQAYAVASLFHDIGMLEEMQRFDIQWPVGMDKDAYIEQFKNIKFIDSTEAEDIQSYEYFPYQEHAFTSASLVHQEVKRFNKHVTQHTNNPLKMEHPIRPAVRAILFHSMCYLPLPQETNVDVGSITAMLLAMTDAIFTWRPSTTSIGNSQNIMCRGFGPAIQADLARFDDKQLEIISDSVFLIRDSAVGDSIQYVLKLIQSFGRLSFASKEWHPVILLEVPDKDLLLQELTALTESLYHEVCDGIRHWLALQHDYMDWPNMPPEAKQNQNLQRLFNTLGSAQSNLGALDEAEVRNSTIYIESSTKVLGNYDVIKFLQLPQVKDFIRHRSKFH